MKNNVLLVTILSLGFVLQACVDDHPVYKTPKGMTDIDPEPTEEWFCRLQIYWYGEGEKESYSGTRFSYEAGNTPEEAEDGDAWIIDDQVITHQAPVSTYNFVIYNLAHEEGAMPGATVRFLIETDSDTERNGNEISIISQTNPHGIVWPYWKVWDSVPPSHSETYSDAYYLLTPTIFVDEYGTHYYEVALPPICEPCGRRQNTWQQSCTLVNK